MHANLFSDLSELLAYGLSCRSHDVPVRPGAVCVCGRSIEVTDQVGGGHCSDLTFPWNAFYFLNLFSALALKLFALFPPQVALFWDFFIPSVSLVHFLLLVTGSLWLLIMTSVMVSHQKCHFLFIYF